MITFRRVIKFKLCLLLFLSQSCSNDEKLRREEEVRFDLIEKNIENGREKSIAKKEREEYLMKAYSLISLLDDSKYKIAKFQEVSEGYYSIKNYERFKLVNQKSLSLAKKFNDSVKMAKGYGFMGMYYRNKELDNAYENFYEAEKIYNSLDQSKYHNQFDYAYDHGRTLTDLAKLSRRVKDYSKSEALTIRAIKKFELSGKEKYLPICYTNLGILAKYLDRYDEAVNYHKKAIEYAEKDPLKKTLYSVLGNNNIGTVYKSFEKYDKAKEYYNKALKNEDFLSKNPKWYAALLDNLAYVNFLSNDLSKIPEDFYESLEIRDSINDLSGIATNTLHLAEYYKTIGEDSISIVFAERAKKASIEVNNNEELLRAYDFLSKISKPKIGLSYAKSYIKLNDSLVKEERKFKDKFARIEYETKQIVEQNLQISRENEILVVAVLGLTALFLLVYIIFRQQQSNKELLFAQQQQETNQEIYRLLLNQQVKLEEGRQMEQQRMSEELHDGVLGRLFGVRLSLDGINQRANDGFTEARTKYIEELKFIEKEIRLISHDLGTETLSPEVAYIDAVESLISDLCEAHKMEFEFRNDENIDWETIDDQKKVNLFRILQESLQNIFKHAKAEMIKISFDFVDDNINLLILDDGIGFKSTKVKRGIGLKNITSRVSQMSGVVDFISNKEAGTTVSVSVPLT